MASSPTKLILINSGCYDYAEVELVGLDTRRLREEHGHLARHLFGAL